MKIICTIGVS